LLVLVLFLYIQAANAHAAINEAEVAVKEAIEDLLKSAQEAPEAIMSGLVDSISNAEQVRVRIKFGFDNS